MSSVNLKNLSISDEAELVENILPSILTDNQPYQVNDDLMLIVISDINNDFAWAHHGKMVVILNKRSRYINASYSLNRQFLSHWMTSCENSDSRQFNLHRDLKIKLGSSDKLLSYNETNPKLASELTGCYVHPSLFFHMRMTFSNMFSIEISEMFHQIMIAQAKKAQETKRLLAETNHKQIIKYINTDDENGSNEKFKRIMSSIQDLSHKIERKEEKKREKKIYKRHFALIKNCPGHSWCFYMTEASNINTFNTNVINYLRANPESETVFNIDVTTSSRINIREIIKGKLSSIFEIGGIEIKGDNRCIRIPDETDIQPRVLIDCVIEIITNIQKGQELIALEQGDHHLVAEAFAQQERLQQKKIETDEYKDYIAREEISDNEIESPELDQYIKPPTTGIISVYNNIKHAAKNLLKRPDQELE